MAHFLDIDTWNRKNHYLHFKAFENPIYNMSANLDVTATLAFSKQHNLSFFHICLYMAITAANRVEEFRYRLQGDKIWVHDVIHPSCTLLNDDNTFSFCQFSCTEKFSQFDKLATEAKNAKSLPQPNHDGQALRDDLIFFSVIPWFSFTTFTHPIQGSNVSSVPNIGIGKYFAQGENTMMPLSLQVNHMIIDGYHIGQFIQQLQFLMDNPEEALK